MKTHFCHHITSLFLLTVWLSALNAYADSAGLPVITFGAGGAAIAQNPYLANPGSGTPPPPLTQQAILNATPLAFPNVIANVSTQAASTGPVLTFDPSQPDSTANTVAAQVYAAQWTLLNQANTTATLANLYPTSYLGGCSSPTPGWGDLDCYNHPWTQYPGNSMPQYQTQYPWKAVGKLFFHEASESQTDDYHFCTAQVISGPPKNLIVTAAHCVSDPYSLTPHKDWVFVPGEMSGIKPYGEFQYSLAVVGTGWINSPGNHRYDVALVSLQNDAQNNPVSFYTGTLGLMLNLPYTQQLTLMGYSTTNVPAGKSTTVNTGQSFYFDDTSICPAFSGTDILLIGSSFGPGASGGAWINQFYPFTASLVGNYVTSVVSGPVMCSGPGPEPNAQSPEGILSGPRFSDDNIGAICTAIGGCSVPAHADCVFDWAAKTYTNLFPAVQGYPSSSTLFSSPYAYRVYATSPTQPYSYLGVSMADQHVYYMMAADGVFHDVGPLSTWATTAGCQ